MTPLFAGRLWLVFALLAPLLIGASTVSARPGGGQSYSGGGSSYGGGSSGGGYSSGGGGYSSGGGGYSSNYGSDYDSDYGGGGGGSEEGTLFAIFALIALFVVYGGVSFLTQVHMPSNTSWQSTPYIPPRPPDLQRMVHRDPKFSTVIFEDFLYHLYAAAHQARESAEAIATLAPHFTPAALDQLGSRLPTGEPIDRIVIGSMTTVQLTIPAIAATTGGLPYYTKLAIKFESNMRIGKGDSRQAYYLDETWQLSRAATAESLPAERMRATLCSNCAAPFAGSDERKCSSCGETVGSGKDNWVVTSITVNTIETRPVSLTGYAPERGTGDLTRFQNGLAQGLASFAKDDPEFSQDALQSRVVHIFGEMYQAWNDDELARARPYVSDSLFNYLRYWLDAYRVEGLENWVEDYQATRVAIAKLVRDQHYDAITVRVWASGKDYTVDKSNRVVGGSKTLARSFSEYWTLIRSANRQGKSSTEKKCPQCGAEQKISMAGNCEFCQAHITSGEFDWVLSKIEQDESYRG